MNNPFSKKNRSNRDRKVRNVSGSSDMKVNSYSSPTKRRTRSKPKKARSSTRIKKYVIRTIAITIITIGIGAFAWNNLRINHVTISSSDGRYTEVIERYLKRNPVANIKPFVSTKVIIEDILNTYPEVASVTLEIPIVGERIEAKIVIREDQLVLKTGDSNYFVVDQDGYAYAEYDENNGFEGVIVLTDDTAVEYESDTVGQFVAPSLVGFIQSINGSLSANKTYEGQSFSYRITDEARVVYTKPSKSKYEIKFQQDLPAEQQMYNLNSALTSLAKRAVTPLKYIDVRLNGTVYYK